METNVLSGEFGFCQGSIRKIRKLVRLWKGNGSFANFMLLIVLFELENWANFYIFCIEEI